MATFDSTQLLDALSSPIGDLISSVGRAVADAQQAMDMRTIESLRRIYDEDEEFFAALRDIGYRPNFYHIPEVTAELAIALSVSGQRDDAGSSGAPIALYATPMDASYTSRYNFDLRAASTVKFRVVPVPPSPQAEAMRVVPKVEDISFAEARAKLDGLGIPWEIDSAKPPKDDKAKVTSQTPEAGEILTRGRVELRFGEENDKSLRAVRGRALKPAVKPKPTPKAEAKPKAKAKSSATPRRR